MVLFSHYESPLSPKFKCKIYDVDSKTVFTSMLHHYVYSIASTIHASNVSKISTMSFHELDVYYNDLLRKFRPLIEPIEINCLVKSNTEKFLQDKNLRDYLLSTKGDLYYHSTSDSRWGVASTQEDLIDVSGHNLFGLSLMIVRGLLSDY